MRGKAGATRVAALLLGLILPLVAHAQTSRRVTVVTSFSKDVTDPIKAAFDRAQPGFVLEVQNRNTNAGVKYLEETRGNNQVDLFWASAPDAFGVLKGAKLLQTYSPKAEGIPKMIGAFPINDPDGFYSGFAASGYGIMWNTRYVRGNRLPEPKEWEDLAKPVFYDHVSMAAPSRSGTTHLTIETILQGEGWDKGWRLIKTMAGNFRQVTDRSFGVPEAVNSGQIGVGIVIDFFALSAQASGFPVKFVYPSVTTIVPANVAIVANAPNRAGAEAFIEFLLSTAGQEVLLAPSIRRLPVNPATYAKAPADYPNPFKDTSLGAKVKFDVGISDKRTDVVDTLFDQLITFQLDTLKGATKAIAEAQAGLARKDDPKASALVAEARDLVAAMPVTDLQAGSAEIAGAFAGGTQKSASQSELERSWASFAVERYGQAKTRAEEALKLLR